MDHVRFTEDPSLRILIKVKKMENKRAVGTKYEQLAMEYLEENGYRILEHNFYSNSGEADIIAVEGRTLCFVEVKYRRNSRYGTAAEAITPYKIRRCIKTAKVYLMKHREFADFNVRFDVVAIDGEHIELIKSAFEA